jgi:hypothetical protein
MIVRCVRLSNQSSNNVTRAFCLLEKDTGVIRTTCYVWGTVVQGCRASVHVSAVGCGAVAVAVLLAAYVVMQRVGAVAGAQVV